MLGTGVVLVLLLVSSPAFKRHLETRFSERLALEVVLQGPLELGFLPGLEFTLQDVHMRRQDVDVASAGRLSVGIDWLPLLRGEIRLNQIVLRDPVVAIERYADGSYNLQRPQPQVTLKLAALEISNATIHFADALEGAQYSATGCNFDLLGRRPVDRASLQTIVGLDISARLGCDELVKDSLTLARVQLAVVASNRVWNFTPVTMELFGGSGSGALLADFSAAEPHYELSYALPHFMIENSLVLLTPRQFIAGAMDFHTSLSAQGETLPALKQSLAGQLSLQGRDLVLTGKNLDAQLASYENSQNFDLIDAGAVLLAGPLGLAATKGFDFASFALESGDSSEIPAVISLWNISAGVAQAEDVALRTEENLIALQGELDFRQGQFRNMTLALVDADGCARITQDIEGTFQHPDIDKPGLFSFVTGPVRALLQQLQPDEDCSVFYRGSLAATP